MSYMQQCVNYVKTNGSGDAMQISEALNIPYQSAVRALQNAQYRGLVTAVTHRSQGRHKGRLPSVYKVPEEKPVVTKAVNSVWGLAAQ